ncbi:MAG TPA: 2'-deoxycytidine 5'-triphosphate deaminase [Frankiaceae bacterium]|nr:2'-deoxycytidine 5'-triphosphate deaminase [Frankiaceae bacterium]
MHGPVHPGVLPAQWLRKAFDAGWITAAAPLEPRQLQPASLDLRLGDQAHRLRCSFLPGDSSVEERLPAFALGPPVPLRGGAILERGRPYLIPLQESLALPDNVLARANPKSSTGRLDIFTRLITDRSTHFDDVGRGYSGRLYLEVVSRSFTIYVEEGLTLNQLRLNQLRPTPHGSPVYLSADRLRKIHQNDPLLMVGQRAVSARRLPVDRDGLFLSLALPDSTKPVGWRAKRNSSLLDLTKVGAHDPRDFWEPVMAERGGGVILEPEEFYLLLSREGVRIPPSYASEMTAFDPTSGELRTHYAGFFDPGFGHSASAYGSRAALEVRAHDVPFKVEHGQRVCKLVFLTMSEEPEELYGENGSNYQFQTETLSKHFVRKAAPRGTGKPPRAAGRVTSAGLFPGE